VTRRANSIAKQLTPDLRSLLIVNREKCGIG
jgi:hypothetical protein